MKTKQVLPTIQLQEIQTKHTQSDKLMKMEKRIVKFTSDSFKEVVYRKHKEKQKHIADLKQKKLPVQIGIKFQPSLTWQRRKVLELHSVHPPPPPFCRVG